MDIGGVIGCDCITLFVTDVKGYIGPMVNNFTLTHSLAAPKVHLPNLDSLFGS